MRKLFERWLDKKGDHRGWVWHDNFAMGEDDTLINCLPKEVLFKSPPKGKVYKVYVKIALELFDAGEGE